MAAPAPQSVAFALGGAIDRADLPALCECVCALLERSGAEVIVCDVTKADPDAVTLDALARVHLTARRHGCSTQLCGASNELIELLDLAGLGSVLPVRLRIEMRREPEEREEPVGVEEERELDDPTVGDLENL
jgi:ABC-type transporter Mla MlaB component